jgi:hypothetical protein
VSTTDPATPQLVVGSWHGFRAWRIAGDQLTGWWRTRYVWQPGVSEAFCHGARWSPVRGPRSRHPDLPAPQRDCKCGIYAVHEPWGLVSRPGRGGPPATSVPDVVVGVVAGWGRAFRGDRGWRSQYARPLALYRPRSGDHRVAAVAERYGIRVVDDLDELLSIGRPGGP